MQGWHRGLVWGLALSSVSNPAIIELSYKGKAPHALPACKGPCYPLKSRLVGPQSGLRGKRESLRPHSEVEFPFSASDSQEEDWLSRIAFFNECLWILRDHAYSALRIHALEDYESKCHNHVFRMDSPRLIQKFKNYQPDGRRYVGRPRTQWEDSLWDVTGYYSRY